MNLTGIPEHNGYTAYIIGVYPVGSGNIGFCPQTNPAMSATITGTTITLGGATTAGGYGDNCILKWGYTPI